MGRCEACAEPEQAKDHDYVTDVCIDYCCKPNAYVEQPLTEVITPAPSPGMSVGASYNSTEDPNLSSPAGPMWTFTFNDEILTDGDKLVHRMECGKRVKFYKVETGVTFESKTADKYLSEPQYGAYMELYDFTTAGGYCELRSDQSKFYFLDSGKLDKKVDRTGQEVTCHYASGKLDYVEDSTGRQVCFEYNTQGLLDAT